MMERPSMISRLSFSSVGPERISFEIISFSTSWKKSLVYTTTFCMWWMFFLTMDPLTMVLFLEGGASYWQIISFNMEVLKLVDRWQVIGWHQPIDAKIIVKLNRKIKKTFETTTQIFFIMIATHFPWWVVTSPYMPGINMICSVTCNFGDWT